jgi:nucleotide-binding universal stress UspA family protein
MSRIVVGLDGLEGSRGALRWAVGEAEIRGASLCLVHVRPAQYRVPGPILRDERGADAADEKSVASEEQRLALDLIERELEAAGADKTSVPIERRGAQGDAAKVLLEAAEDAELLVLGSTPHHGFTHAVLGDVAAKCVAHASCPVVVVPDRFRRTLES